MHKRTLFILLVIAGVLCWAFPVVLEQLGEPRLLPDGMDSLLGLVGMTVFCAALNVLRRLDKASDPACRREQKALHDERNTAIQNKARAISGDITMLAVLLAAMFFQAFEGPEIPGWISWFLFGIVIGNLLLSLALHRWLQRKM